MKVTGVVLAIIGAVLLIGSGVMAMLAQDGRNASGLMAEDGNMQRMCLWPAAIGTASLVTGALMLVYGGRGYIISNDPAIHS